MPPHPTSRSATLCTTIRRSHLLKRQRTSDHCTFTLLVAPPADPRGRCFQFSAFVRPSTHTKMGRIRAFELINAFNESGVSVESSSLSVLRQIYLHLLSHRTVENIQRTKVGYVPRGLVNDTTATPGCAQWRIYRIIDPAASVLIADPPHCSPQS